MTNIQEIALVVALHVGGFKPSLRTGCPQFVHAFARREQGCPQAEQLTRLGFCIRSLFLFRREQHVSTQPSPSRHDYSERRSRPSAMTKVPACSATSQRNSSARSGEIKIERALPSCIHFTSSRSSDHAGLPSGFEVGVTDTISASGTSQCNTPLLIASRSGVTS